MKECLYRGRDICTNELVEGFLIRGVRTYIATKEAIENMVVSVAYMAGLRLVEIDPKTLSEFTGCVDCKGVKIFTNDVVYEGCNGFVGTVIWDKNLGTYRLDFGETYVIADAHIEWTVIKNVKSEYVGRIEYLGPKGNIVETIEYKNEKYFVESIEKACNTGAPIFVVAYKNINHESVSLDFLKDLGSMPKGVYTVTDPHLVPKED